jgi:hypothetical protein
MTTILSALTTPMTAKALAIALGKSESRTRELLAAEVKAGTVKSDGAKPAMFSRVEVAEAKPKAKRAALLNPQPKIDAMVEEAAAFGCVLAYSRGTRTWILSGPISGEFTPAELAALRDGDGFESWLASRKRK